MRRSSSAPASPSGTRRPTRSWPSSPSCRSNHRRFVREAPAGAARPPPPLVRVIAVSITATFWVQMIVFVILALFTMRFIWPPITAALDERAAKIREGLSAADKAKAELVSANKRIEEELSSARTDAAQRLADAERLAQSMIEEAKSRASEEGAKIVAAARAEAEQEASKARETLRDQVAALAVRGAEQILRREVDARTHADLLGQLKSQL